MKVSKVVIDVYHPRENGTCAEVSVVFDSSLAIHKVRVINGEKGLFVAMPNTGDIKVLANKKRYKDLVHPINKTLSNEITNEVITAYNNYTED